jgi:hypothetical protein
MAISPHTATDAKDKAASTPATSIQSETPVVLGLTDTKTDTKRVKISVGSVAGDYAW